MCFGDGKRAFGQRSGFVECHCGDFSRCVDVVSAFEQNAQSRRGTDAPEISERNAHHQCARAGYDQKDQSAIEPFFEHVACAECERPQIGEDDN